MDDVLVKERIATLQQAVRGWAVRRDLWRDAEFKSFQEHFDDTPESDPVALVLCFDSDLVSLFRHDRTDSDEAIEEFGSLVEAAGFRWQHDDHTTIKFYSLSDQESYRHYFDFQWICSLLAPDLARVSEDLFQHFRRRPDDLLKVEPRALEVLLDAAFASQGFRTDLGPGVADGGIDLRLYRHDVLGEVQTLVQIKRYAKDRPIRLEAVAALHSIVVSERANRGLFVTTSRFLPGTRKFAERQGHLIQLADTEDMVRWCANAESSIAASRAPVAIDGILASVRDRMRLEGSLGCIVHGTWGHDMTINEFAMIVRETPGAVLLAHLEKQVVDSGPRAQTGQEVPVLKFRVNHEGDQVFVAKKKTGEGPLQFWGARILYSLWDGEPQPFNYCD